MNLRNITLFCIIPVFLISCSPKYKSQFKQELADAISSRYPFKVDNVSLKVINQGKKGQEFTYHADLRTTEDLYTDVPADNSDLDKFVAYSSIVDRAPLTPQQRTELKQKVDVIVATASAKFKANGGGNILDGIDPRATIPVKKIATPSGTKVTMDGKATALQDDFGKWSFSYEKQQFSAFEGARAGNDRWVLAGSAEHKALKQLTHDILSQCRAVEEDAVKVAEDELQKQRAINEAEQKQRAEEAKQRLMAGVSACASGKVYHGLWQTENAKGEIGIRFDRQTETPDGYSIDGALFDPAFPDHIKPFTGTFSGDGSSEHPFEMKLSTTRGEGFFLVEGRGGPNEPYAKPYTDKTAGFLIASTAYPILLHYSALKKTFYGQIRANYLNPFLSQWGEPVKIFFSSDYKTKTVAPISPAEGTLAGITPAASAQSTSSGAEIDFAKLLNGSITTGKRTPDQVHAENAVVLKEFAEGFRSARAQNDVPKMKEIIQQVLAKYPDTATTHYWLQNIAFLEHNADEVKKQHDILIADFPETPDLSAKREQQYSEFMKALSSGQ